MSGMEHLPDNVRDDALDRDSQPRKHPLRRRIGKLIVGLVLVGIPVLLWFAPQIVGRFASQPTLLNTIAPNLPSNLRIGKASLRWESPVLLRDVSLEAEDGSEMVKVDAVTSRESLWELVTNIKLPLTLDLEGIEMTCVVKKPVYGGRLDLDEELDIFARFLRRFAAIGIPAPSRQTTVRLSGGSITLVDEEGAMLTRLAPVSGTCVLLPNDPDQPLPPEAVSQLTLDLPVEQSGGEGICELNAEWANAHAMTETEPEWAAVSLKLKGMPVDGLKPLLAEPLDGAMVAGNVDGELKVRVSRSQNGTVRLGGQASVGSPTAAEPRLVIVGDGERPRPFYLQWAATDLEISYDRAIDQFAIEPLRFRSEPFEASLQGTVDELTRRAVCQLTGTVRCDLQEYAALIPPELRRQVDVEGLRLTGFQLEGPLRSRAALSSSPSPRNVLNAGESPRERASADRGLSLTARVAWDRLGAFGVESKKGLVQLSVDRGIVQLQPVGVLVNGGRLRSLPNVDLRGSPAALELQPGTVLEEVELSEELCRGWLKYVSPVMANATSVSGRLTLSSAGGRIPLDAPDDAAVDGSLTIREGEIGAGPLVQPIVDVVEQVQSILRQDRGGRRQRGIAERLKVTLVGGEVPFHMKDGRVYHERLRFEAGSVLFSTSGSVGLDESLDLKMNMILPDGWFADKGPVLSSLRSEPIEITVSGTLDDPQIDRAPLAQLGTRIGVKAAEGLLLELLNKGIDRRERKE